MEYASKNIGLRGQFVTQEGTNIIRIDKGRPKIMDLPLQQIDHITITHKGKIIDNTGKNYILYDNNTGVSGLVDIKKYHEVKNLKGGTGMNNGEILYEYGENLLPKIPTKRVETHIPASDWMNWKNWCNNE